VAAPDHAQRGGAALRQISSGNPARRTGPELPQTVGLDHGDESGRLRVEEADDERRSLGRRGIELPTGEAEAEIRRGHVRERALGKPEPPSRRDLDLAGRHPAEARFDGVDGGVRRDERGDVGLGEVQRHGVSLGTAATRP
jgi:hypothetical protein